MYLFRYVRATLPLPAFFPYEPIVFISNPDLIIRKHNILSLCYWLTQPPKTDQFFAATRIWKQINAPAVITSAPVCHYTLHLAERQRGATEDEEVVEGGAERGGAREIRR